MTSKKKKQKKQTNQQQKYTDLKRITRRKFLRCNHELSHVSSPHTLFIQTTYSTSSLVQTLKYNRCKFAFISLCFQQHSYFKFNSLWTDAIKNLWSEWDKKPLQKSVHITLLALLLIQVFVFIILYYSDMFMILSSGKYNVEEDTQGKGWSQGRGGGLG